MNKKTKMKNTKKKQKETIKQILHGCTTSLFTMRQEDQSFNKPLL